MSYNFDKFENQLLQWNFTLTNEKKEQFSIYYDLLVEWNKIMNLTAIIEFDEVVEKHFLDSIALGAYLNLNDSLKMIDLGTGAGFPGVPLKIMFPKLEVLLADSLNKRIRFLKELILQLNLVQVEAVHGRAEELARKDRYREQYDLCVSRAVSNLSSLSEYCLPFVKEGGIFVAYKSSEIYQEVGNSKKAIQTLGGKVRSVEVFRLADTEYQRSFVFIDKVKRTSKRFPRKAGTPIKEPL